MTDTLRGEVVINEGDRSLTATFEHWQAILDVLLDWSLNDPERDQAKDAMVCMQVVINACRASRKYQRDQIPLQREINIKFNSHEWFIIKSAVLQYIRAVKERRG